MHLHCYLSKLDWSKLMISNRNFTLKCVLNYSISIAASYNSELWQNLQLEQCCNPGLMSCLVSWPESTWSLMIHTARIVLALLTLGRWWYQMPWKRWSRSNISIYFSQLYSLFYEHGLRISTAGCWMWNTYQDINNHSLLESIALTRHKCSINWSVKV